MRKWRLFDVGVHRLRAFCFPQKALYTPYPYMLQARSVEDI